MAVSNQTATSLHTDLPDAVVLYDGVCVLCSAWFRFVAARDPGARFRFAQTQNGRGRALAISLGIDPDNPRTNALILNGRAYLYSDAALLVLLHLPRWHWFARAALLLPRGIRDPLYRLIARNRYRMFGRTDTCLIPDASLRRHVLPED